MEKLRVLDLFSGIGGFSLGLERTGGFETVAFCEIDPFWRSIGRNPALCSWRTSQLSLAAEWETFSEQFPTSGSMRNGTTVSACSVGHTHVRRRVFIVAYAHSFDGRERLRDSLARAFRTLQEGDGFARARAGQRARLANPSALYGGADGVPFGMERNRAHGNAIVHEIPQAIGHAILESMRAA